MSLPVAEERRLYFQPRPGIRTHESLEELPSRLWLNHPFRPFTDPDHCRFKVRWAAARFKAEHEADALWESMRMSHIQNKTKIEKILAQATVCNQQNDRNRIDNLQKHATALLLDLDGRKDFTEKAEYLQGLESVMREAAYVAIKIDDLRRKNIDLTNKSNNINQFLLALGEEEDRWESRIAELKRIRKKLEEPRSPVAKYMLLMLPLLLLLIVY